MTMGSHVQSFTAIVIDDDRATVHLFSDMLEMMGVKVLAKGFDGKDAVRLYKKYSPDIVFTDITMPEYDGFYAIEEIKKFDPHAKVVAVTAYCTYESARRLEKSKVSARIYKPFDIQDIKKVLFEKYQIKIS